MYTIGVCVGGVYNRGVFSGWMYNMGVVVCII